MTALPKADLITTTAPAWEPSARRATHPQELAIVTCPSGHRTLLAAPAYAVAADGTVAPTCACGLRSCGWTADLQLTGWSP